MTVLIVDADADNLAFLRQVFLKASYRVLTARKGAAAWKLLLKEHSRIDLLLCEVTLPGISGPELNAIVKQSFPSVVVIFMTGASEQGLDPRIKVLRKPLSPGIAIQAVQQIISKVHHRRAVNL